MKKEIPVKEGLRFEAACSIIMRDTIEKHMHTFALTIRRDRVAGQAMLAAYIDGLAGNIALVVAGGHGSRDEVLESVTEKLRDAVNRDLRHLAGI